MLTTADDSCRLSSLTNRRNTYSLLRMPDSLHLASQLSPFHPPKQAYCSKHDADFIDKQYCAEQCSRKEGPKDLLSSSMEVMMQKQAQGPPVFRVERRSREAAWLQH